MWKAVCLAAVVCCRVAPALEVVQPAVAFALRGETAVLPCSISPGSAAVERRIPQWYYGQRANKTANVYPENELSSAEHRGRVVMDPRGDDSLSLEIRGVRPGDHNTYYCALSCLLNQTYYRLTGNGTLLFVHEPIQMSQSPCMGKNITLSCRVVVARPDKVRLVWRKANTSLVARSFVQYVPGSGMVVIKSQLTISSSEEVETYTCLLMYDSHLCLPGESITISSMKLPVLLYIASLIISLLTLLAVAGVLLFRRVCA